VQINELDLAWEDDADRGRHRRSAVKQRANGGKKRGRGGKTFLALFLSLVVLGGLAAGGWYGVDRIKAFFSAPDYETGGTGETKIEVLDGQSATEIGQTLQKADVVKSAKAFAEAAKKDPRSTKIQPGTYKVRLKMRAADALAMLLDLKNKVVNRVTIREGLSYKATLAELSKATNIPVADFEAAAKDPVALGVPAFWFNRRDGKPSAKSIEGFLYPLTYEIEPDSTATSILKTMVAQFLKVTTAMNFVDKVQSERNISPYEALIVASLAEAESGVTADLPKIARVAYNRTFKKKMPLQFDVTANYWLEVQGKDPKHSSKLSQAELDDPNNPYNTESKVGLPLGPINSPGEAALKGAMEPAVGDWLFFVAIDLQGNSAFAVTVDEHDKNVRLACKNGVPLC
jgi:UPF0755 protein